MPTRRRRCRAPGPGRRSSRPAPPPASRCASSCRRSTTLLHDPRARALYLYPTKALARTRRARSTPSGCTRRSAPRSMTATRRARTAPRSAGARTSILTNPDMLHVGMLPNHARWGDCWRTSRSSSSTRRTSTAASSARTSPTCCAVCAGSPRPTARRRASCWRSATIANPVELAERLTGLEDVAPDRRGRLARRPASDRDVEPAARATRRSARGAACSPRPPRSCAPSSARAGARTICFIKSRKGVELVAKLAADELERDGEPELADRVAPYRAGYTPQQRRELEAKLVERRAARRSSRRTRWSWASTSARSTPRSA